jgi:hypothetical protein
MPIKIPNFGTFLSALNTAGIKTASARGFWGGVTKDDDIVLTTWTDAGRGGDRFRVWRPRTRHGGLLDMWELGRIEPGATVKLIMLRQRGNTPLDKGPRTVHSAGLMAGRWRIVELIEGGAIVEPVSTRQ